eukprot:16505-Heterococcus_DN1.PRE.8
MRERQTNILTMQDIEDLGMDKLVLDTALISTANLNTDTTTAVPNTPTAGTTANTLHACSTTTHHHASGN